MNNILLEVSTHFEHLSEYCYAVYQGGSRVDPVIDKPNDYDYIWFTKPRQRHFLANELKRLGLKINWSHKLDKNKEDHYLDCSQVRIYPYTQIDWFSYLDILMIKFIGDDVCPKTDIIQEHRDEFLKDLIQKAYLIEKNIITNQKRWYHILRGVYILLNNSYEVTEEQHKEINMLHDLAPGWESIRDKTIQLLNNLN